MNLQKKLTQLSDKLKPKIDDALNHEVADTVKSVEAATIDEVVYGVYAPKEYRRRDRNGGIGDTDNMQHTVKDGQLIVINTTPPNPAGCPSGRFVTVNKNLSELIEYGHDYKGHQYDFPRSGTAYMEPRPFTKETIERLYTQKDHVTALKAGLKRRGIDSK